MVKLVHIHKMTIAYSITKSRKQHEVRTANIRYMAVLRRAQQRATLRTEHKVMHNLLYAQIAPGLRDRVLARHRDLTQKLG